MKEQADVNEITYPWNIDFKNTNAIYEDWDHLQLRIEDLKLHRFYQHKRFKTLVDKALIKNFEGRYNDALLIYINLENLIIEDK